MNPLLLFFAFCLPARAAIAYGSTVVPRAYLSYFGAVLMAVALGFLYLYFTGGRMGAPEAGGVTWWAPYRLLVGGLWMIAAIYALQGKRDLVWIPLVMDILLGVFLTVSTVV